MVMYRWHCRVQICVVILVRATTKSCGRKHALARLKAVTCLHVEQASQLCIQLSMAILGLQQRRPNNVLRLNSQARTCSKQ